MRILLLGPIHRQKEYFLQKENLPFLRGQGQQSWVDALERLNQKVFVFRYTDSILVPDKIKNVIEELIAKTFPRTKARYDRFKDAYYFFSLENTLRSRKLLTVAKKTKPDLLIISGGINNVFPHTIKEIKEMCHSKVLLFSGINPLTSATSVEKILVREGIVDIVIENDSEYARLWEKIGAKRTIVLPISSVDPNLYQKVQLTKKEKEAFGCDVCFVGSLTKDRQEILKSIRQAQDKQVMDDKYNIKIWGDIPATVNLDQSLRSHYKGEAFGEKMVKIFNAAKIVLNFQPKDMKAGGNMRTFEIPGCGAFQLADKADARWLVPEKEVALFKNKDDLSAKIRYYLEHESKRQEVAESGYKRVHKEHTYDEHFKKLLSEIQ